MIITTITKIQINFNKEVDYLIIFSKEEEVDLQEVKIRLPRSEGK